MSSFAVTSNSILNFQELQYSKIDKKVIKHIEDQNEKKRKLVEEAKNNNMLQECGCCYNDECLLEDMYSCKEGHNFCQDCVQRASEVSKFSKNEKPFKNWSCKKAIYVFDILFIFKQVAMGDGKIMLHCLGSCEASFDITVLQKALKPDFFSKWFRKIQMAEIGEVSTRKGLIDWL